TSGANCTFTPATGMTDTSGIFASTLTTYTAQSMTVTASFASLNPNVSVDFTVTSVVALSDSVGRSMCAIFNNGGAKCWGANSYGALGYGDTLYRGNGPNEMGTNLPFVNLGVGRSANAISMQYWGACALMDNHN